MRPSPSIIDGATVLCWAETAGIAKTDACTFHRDRELQSDFAGVAIARYRDNSGCYLFLCNENWETQNDSLHDDLAEAKEFAESLYPGIWGRWQTAGVQSG